MSKSLYVIAAVAMALMPLGVASAGVSPPPNGGTVSIEANSADGSADTALPTFTDALSKALTNRGFTVFEDQGHAASDIELLVSRSNVGTASARVSGESSPSMAGMGAVIPLSTGDSQQVPLRRTRLEMRVRRRGDPTVLWDGSAVTVREAGTTKGSDVTVASDLIGALLQTYPTQPRGVIGVP